MIKTQLSLFMLCVVSTNSSSLLAANQQTLLPTLEQQANKFRDQNKQRFLSLASQDPNRMSQLISSYNKTWFQVFMWDAFSNLNEFESALKKDSQRIRQVDSTLYTQLRLPNYKNSNFESKWSELSKTPGTEYTQKVSSEFGTLSEKRWVSPQGVRIIETLVPSSSGEPALFETRYNPSTQTVIFQRAYLRQAPNFVPSIRFIEGKGMPTTMYMRLYQMKVLGVPYGQAQNIVLYKVEYFEALARLDWLKRQYPTRQLGWLYAQTQRDQYLNTVLNLTGHRLGSAYTLNAGGYGSLQIFARRDSNFAGEESSQQTRFEQTLQRYGLTQNSKIMMEFNATAKLVRVSQ